MWQKKAKNEHAKAVFVLFGNILNIANPFLIKLCRVDLTKCKNLKRSFLRVKCYYWKTNYLSKYELLGMLNNKISELRSKTFHSIAN